MRIKFQTRKVNVLQFNGFTYVSVSAVHERLVEVEIRAQEIPPEHLYLPLRLLPHHGLQPGDLVQGGQQVTADAGEDGVDLEKKIFARLLTTYILYQM